MSNEDLSAGVTGLHRLQTRDEGFHTSVAQAVAWNAKLLNKLVTRMNTLEASVALVTTDTTRILDGVNDLGIERGAKLRTVLEAMISMLKVDFERLEMAAAAALPAGPLEDPDLSKIGEAFDGLQ